MKYLLIFGIVMVALWLWRNNRRGDTADARTKAGKGRAIRPELPTEIVECAVCKVHLPRAEALAGPGGGIYCSAAHRQQAEGAR